MKLRGRELRKAKGKRRWTPWWRERERAGAHSRFNKAKLDALYKLDRLHARAVNEWIGRWHNRTELIEKILRGTAAVLMQKEALGRPLETPLPPGAEAGGLPHVLRRSWEGAVLRISLLAEALRTFAEARVWAPGPGGRYSPRGVRPLLRDARDGLLACLGVSGGAGGGGGKVVRMDDWAFRRWAGQFLETVDQVL